MRLLFGADVNPNPNSGAAGTVLETAKALRLLGAEVDAFWQDSLSQRIKHANMHHLIEQPLSYRREIKRRLKFKKYDVVQLSQPHAYLAGREVLARSPRPLFIWRSHGLEAKVDDALRKYAPQSPPFWKRVLRGMANQALNKVQRAAIVYSDGVIVPCADDRDYLIDRFGAQPARIRVIWHGVPDQYLDSPLSSRPDRWTRLLHISQMSVNKGPKVVHHVVQSVLKAVQDATMTWVCPIEHHDQIRRDLGSEFANRVHLRDWGAREELMQLYDSHGIFLYPTISEGAAKVVMEAMARGMCVVSSRTSGPYDYIGADRNGLLVPVGDAEAMARAAIKVLKDARMAMSLGQSARALARDFRWSRCAQQALDFYRDLSEITGRDKVTRR